MALSLRTNLFVWIFVATVVPLTALALGATYYSEQRYKADVAREINASLTNLSVEIDRYLRLEREILRGLTNVRAVRDLLPTLARPASDEALGSYRDANARLGQVLAELQEILPGRYTWRLLDANGNTLVKVSNGQISKPTYETLGGLPYAEQEILDAQFRRELAELPPAEVSFTMLPQRQTQFANLGSQAVLDFLYPLQLGRATVGTLTMSLLGEQIDSIVNHAPRLYKGALFIVEVNPDNPMRHGLVIYDDAHELHVAQVRGDTQRLSELYDAELLSSLNARPYGIVNRANADSSVYFLEFFPYPNLLVSWVVGLQIDNRTIDELFVNIRLGIWIFAATALVISLALATLGARKIAKPVRLLASNLKAFADGEQRLNVDTQGVAEIDELATSFNYMAGHIERARAERDKAEHMMLQSAKLASIGQMAAGIGHELNNPLNNILSLSKLLARNLPPDEPRLHQDLASLREEALRASGIVSGILNFARQVPPHFAQFEVKSWLESTLALVRQQARSKGVRLDYDIDGDYQMKGDRGQLQQALVNLLLNAIYATPSGQEVRVDVGLRDDRLVLHVRDHGSGLSSELRDRIFDPFFTTKPVGEGSGLGLSICLGIVEDHAGTLTIDNHPDGGAVASMTLPLQNRPSGSSSSRDTQA
ncbi:MAG: hypothetical protein AMJ69_01970 [Gammaproteobacteria bacterium SG8_47]|nr:MAG: hypothetical protein AMJ69_01970 [Gammaproteobacteria bacterium SG8_47]